MSEPAGRSTSSHAAERDPSSCNTARRALARRDLPRRVPAGLRPPLSGGGRAGRTRRALLPSPEHGTPRCPRGSSGPLTHGCSVSVGAEAQCRIRCHVYASSWSCWSGPASHACSRGFRGRCGGRIAPAITHRARVACSTRSRRTTSQPRQAPSVRRRSRRRGRPTAVPRTCRLRVTCEMLRAHGEPGAVARCAGGGDRCEPPRRRRRSARG